jgi:pectinesterase
MKAREVETTRRTIVDTRIIRVARDGPADFRTITQALAAIAAGAGLPAVISIGAGIYREKLRIETPGLTLIGEGSERTIISFDDYAWKPLPSGERMNTFNSYTVYIGAPDFQARGLCIENSAGDGRTVGQAIACYVDADRASFFDCRFAGRQDTLCLGPLPDNPLPKGLNLVHPVAIAGENGTEKPFRNYFLNCRIEGDIDFIFGSASAVFDACTIVSLDRGEKINGYIAAPSTLPGQVFGFVFLDCLLEGDAGPGSVFLGRPWRPTAKAAYVRCRMGKHIRDEGWDNWDNPENKKTAEFVECDNKSPGAKSRAPWAKMLETGKAEGFSPESVLSGFDSWKPFAR